MVDAVEEFLQIHVHHHPAALGNVLPGRLHRTLWPLLTSAWASQHLSMPVAQGTHADLPGYDAPTFTLMPVGYTSQRPVQVLGFDDICRLAPLQRLLSASCSSGQRFAFSFLQIRSRPRHPCRSANSSPCRASKGLSPPSECALPGAQKKRASCDARWQNHAAGLLRLVAVDS